MPSINSVKEFANDQYYHVYNRGIDKRVIFLDEQDYTVFLGLLKKYLTGINTDKTNRHAFMSFEGKIELLSYCLMPNHFHLFFYQTDKDALTQLMRRIGTGYVMYFNNRYSRSGRLFQGIYKASCVDKDNYLHHVSRYIHLNPDNYQSYPYSSLDYYLGNKKSEWVKPDRILELFDSKEEYMNFIADYIDTKEEIAGFKWQLADHGQDL